MGFLGRFLSSYSESFAAAVAAWPFASFALYAAHPGDPLPPRRGASGRCPRAGAYVSVLYLLGLVCFTLYPLPEGDSGPGITYGLDPIWNPLHFVGDIAADGAARRGAAGRQRRAVRPVRLHRGPRHAARRARVGRPGLPGVARHRARPAHRPVRRLPVRVPHLRDDRPGDEHAGRPVRFGCWRGRRCASCPTPAGSRRPPSRRAPAS